MPYPTYKKTAFGLLVLHHPASASPYKNNKKSIRGACSHEI